MVSGGKRNVIFTKKEFLQFPRSAAREECLDVVVALGGYSIVLRIYLLKKDDSEREVNKDFTAALSMLQLALYRLLTGKRLAPWKRAYRYRFETSRRVGIAFN
jgi:hypothetical protein